MPSAFPDGQKGFVGGTADIATGLTNLGAREYQPGTGSFISPDPLIDPYNPQDLNPYSYSKDNPSTLSDPTGQSWEPYSGEIGSTGWQPIGGSDKVENWFWAHIGIVVAIPPNVAVKWTLLVAGAVFNNPEADVAWNIFTWRWLTAKGKRTDDYKTRAQWTTRYKIHWAIFFWAWTLAQGELYHTTTSVYVQYAHGTPWNGKPAPTPKP